MGKGVAYHGRATDLVSADQAVVSGASFLTTIGRFAFPSELGLYSLAASLLISLFCIQESLITLPYTVQRHRPIGTPAEYAGSSLALSVLALLVLAAGALGISMFSMKGELAAVGGRWRQWHRSHCYDNLPEGLPLPTWTCQRL
jgi:hypothetical protein